MTAGRETTAVAVAGVNRGRAVGASMAATGVARIVQISLSLLQVPILIGHLGTERFGELAALLAAVQALVVLESSFGMGVSRAVASALAQGRHVDAMAIISNAVGLSGFFALGLILVAALAAPMLDGVAFGGGLALVGAAFFGTSLVFGIAHKTDLARLNGVRASGWQLAGTLWSFAALLMAVAWTKEVGWTAAAVLSGPAMAALVSFLLLFRVKAPELHPRTSAISRSSLKTILLTGGWLVLGFAGWAAATNMDIPLALSVWGGAASTELALSYRAWAIAHIGMSMLVAPLVPAIADASGRGDVTWIKRTLGKTVISFLLLAAIGLGLAYLIGPQVLAAWSGGVVMPGRSLVVLMGFSALSSAAVLVYCSVLVALGRSTTVGKGMLVLSSIAIVVKLSIANLATSPEHLPAASGLLATVGLGIALVAQAAKRRTRRATTAETGGGASS